MDNTLKLLIEELKIVTYNSKPNIKYQDQMDLIERLENELQYYIKQTLITPEFELSNKPETTIHMSEVKEIINIVEPVIDFIPKELPKSNTKTKGKNIK